MRWRYGGNCRQMLKLLAHQGSSQGAAFRSIEHTFSMKEAMANNEDLLFLPVSYLKNSI
jgi:hypothetical protein